MRRRLEFHVFWLFVFAVSNHLCADQSLDELIASSVEAAGDNADEIKAALKDVPSDQSVGMRFLVAYMPERDLTSLSADFLLENVEYAYKAWRESPWRAQVSEEIFLNEVLPYANINERRDRWRKEFYERCKPMIEGIDQPSLAAAKLNQKLFPELKVKYSTKRRRADQSPFESIESGLASCTGLSVLLIDACRSVGIPARFVGTPLWSDRSGNHSWVEVYDQGWHFTGAAEPAGDALDQAWFIDRASKAKRDDQYHAIYAVSYRKTPQKFPMVWARSLDYIHAVNVTDRYTREKQELPEDAVRIRFRVFAEDGGRCAAAICIKDQTGEMLFSGKSNDERFDSNDHVTVPLKKGLPYTVEVDFGGKKQTDTFKAEAEGQLETLHLE